MGRSGRKHGIGKWRIDQAIDDAGAPTIDGDALIYVGRDDEGLLLEIVLVPDDKQKAELTCIHAMPAEWRDR